MQVQVNLLLDVTVSLFEKKWQILKQIDTILNEPEDNMGTFVTFRTHKYRLTPESFCFVSEKYVFVSRLTGHRVKKIVVC